MTVRLVLLAAFAALTGPVAAKEPPEATPAGFPYPVVVLLRDASVQEELRLKERQKKTIREVIAQVDEPLWLLRDVPPRQAWDKTGPLVAKVEFAAQQVLDDSQRRRFEQILLQAMGSAALGRPAVARELKLMPEQQQQLAAIDESAQRELRELQEKVKAGQEKDGSAKTSAILAQQQQRRAAVLTELQKQQWAVLGGKPFDFSRVRQVGVVAPELRAVEAWVNSAPMTIASLRGRVVALHFWTFG